MTDKIEIRESAPGDISLIEELYPDAFPDEDLLPLVRELLGEGTGILSLVALAGETLAGHIVFTMCGIAGEPGKAALLGPLAVAPARQRQGIGSALVRAGLQRLESAGVARVCVLGDPAYYGRFGFAPDARITPPYPLPEAWRDAWRSLGLHADDSALSGPLSVPTPWRRPELWSA